MSKNNSFIPEIAFLVYDPDIQLYRKKHELVVSYWRFLVFSLYSWITGGRFTKTLAVMSLGLALISCADTDGPPKDIIGTAATGAATQGTVFVVDATGVAISKTINADGSFRLDVRHMTAPFMLKSVASNGVDPDLFSYVAAIEGASATVNITPLTNLAMFVANGNADPGVLYDSWASAFGNITATTIKQAQAVVNANLHTQCTAFSLDPFTYDFIGTRFYAGGSGTGIDGMLDALTIDLVAGTVDVIGVGTLLFNYAISTVGYDIGGDSAATSGAYLLKMRLSVDGGSSSSDLTLSINLPASLVATDVDSQVLQDTFRSFYGSVGSVVINSVTVNPDAVTPSTIIAVVDATITTPEAVDKNYVATYTYTLNP
ncbi:MAG: hypothetical protein OEY66_08265 [Gammaproteobacteria bacterium]|nr:hypothetical protein [Gammaproteobacteria bacterium]